MEYFLTGMHNQLQMNLYLNIIALRDVLEKDSLSLMYENALGTSKLKHSKYSFYPHLLIQLKLYVWE